LKEKKAAAEANGDSPKKIAKLDARINKASKSVDKFKEKQKEAEEVGKDAWGDIGAGVSQMGQAMVAAGTATSMLGGLLSSLGFE
jgi:glycerate kinase